MAESSSRERSSASCSSRERSSAVGKFNVYTGEPASTHLPTAAQLGLEPPRYCAECGRRMTVQVRPDGWWARCSRHGLLDSNDLETKR